MPKTPVIFDCDTGVDDAIAILLLNRLPQLDVLAITTVAGNVEVEKTTPNTLKVLELIGSNIPVYQGASKPLFREQVIATYMHGADGLAGVELPLTRTIASDKPAWDVIYEHALASAGKLEIIAVGPLTNLGLAFIKYRDLPGLLKRIVIMGGSASVGNITPAAEFNIYADPDAADLVFSSGVPVCMCGLDVTLKAYFTAEEIDEVGKLGSKVAHFFHDVTQNPLAFSCKFGLPGLCLHDPMTVLFAADESIFETHTVGIRVETKGRLTKGRTVTDLYSDAQFPHQNAIIVTNLDREAFRKKIFDLIAEYN